MVINRGTERLAGKKLGWGNVGGGSRFRTHSENYVETISVLNKRKRVLNESLDQFFSATPFKKYTIMMKLPVSKNKKRQGWGGGVQLIELIGKGSRTESIDER